MASDPARMLRELAQQFFHHKQQNKTLSAQSKRRPHGQALNDLERSFESLLERWVPDTEQQDAWRAHFYHYADAPEEPVLEAPPLFKGSDSRGRVAEIRPRPDATYTIIVDGKPARQATDPLRLGESSLRAVRLAGTEFGEVFEASDEAVDALLDYIADPKSGAPWDHAPTLFGDGLIDMNFALTARGRRLLDFRRRGGRSSTELVL